MKSTTVNFVNSVNSPIVCVVLALDSWNYCSGKQAQQPNICKIPQSSLYSWTMYINKKIRCCHPYAIPLSQGGTCWEFYFLLLNEAIHGKHWEEVVGLLGLISRAIVPTV